MARSKQANSKAAGAAGGVLSSGITGKASKAVAASALTQRHSSKETTGKEAATAASKVLCDGRTSKDSKPAAGSVTPQRKK